MQTLRRTVLRRYCRQQPSAPSALDPSPSHHRIGTVRRAFSTSSPKSSAILAHDFATLTPCLLLRKLLQQHTELDGTDVGTWRDPGEKYIVISQAKFAHFCAAAHVEDAEAALAYLAAAGVVVVLDGGKLIHLRPVLYLETLEMIHGAATTSSTSNNATSAAHSKPSATGCSFMLEEAERRVVELAKREKEMRSRLRPAIAQAARWRRTVWGGALLYAGAQLAIISRLTYFDLDWDVMEPVSYVMTMANALLFFLYYLRFNEEHSYSKFDQRFLPRKVRQYAPPDFDWAAYADVCRQLVEERAMLDRISKWAEAR
ncbi:hypothetical protein CUR178_03541 [Leishmania enriettii]|uniref:Calcium uniporter protein C-terminal domain-containing protein n=1 Tax=Leishmania enriettii TaxID=5663 RepID=A0A836HFI4_LEIEN|nr:hypothetical protein CUR178_03541 [Leishmania enriettii]